MRPYVAILRDSFRQAMVSWTLWVMLVVITLVLVLLAGIGYRDRLMTRFTSHDLLDSRAAARTLVQGRQAEPGMPAHLCWQLLTEDQQQSLLRIARDDATDDDADRDPGTRVSTYFTDSREVIEALNALIEHPEFFDEAVWGNVPRSRELQQLWDEGEAASAEQQLRRNRLLLQSQLRRHVIHRPGDRVAITYWGAEFPMDAMPLTKGRLDAIVQQVVIPSVMKLFVGVIGILVAILVTSPMIPRVFESSSLYLLLSKPVSRSLVFLTQFAGGCAFILIYVSYIILGLFLILGWRLEIWNFGFLWCIPIFLFVFAIFYTVSALAGVVWKNAIVSVACTVVFWAACWTIGTTHQMFQTLLIDMERFVHVLPAGETFFAVQETGQCLVWNEQEQDWSAAFRRGGAGTTRWVGLLHDPQTDRVIAATRDQNPFMQFSLAPTLFQAGDDTGWQIQDGPALPSGTAALWREPQGTLAVATNEGIYRITSWPEDEPAEQQAERQGGMWRLLQRSLTRHQPLEFAGPDPPLDLAAPVQAAIGSSGRVAISGQGELILLEPLPPVPDQSDAPTYRVAGHRLLRRIDSPAPESDIEKGSNVAYTTDTSASAPHGLDNWDSGEPSESAPLMAMTDRHLLLAHNDGQLTILDARTLEPVLEERPVRRAAPRFVYAGESLLAVLYHDHNLWLFDPERLEWTRPRLPGQGEISSAHFLPGDRLLIATPAKKLQIVDPATRHVEQTIGGDTSIWLTAFRYAVRPIYTVFPKPADLDDTVGYVITGKRTVENPFVDDGVDQMQQQLDPWRPIWGNLLFIVVLLGLGCLYMERQQF